MGSRNAFTSLPTEITDLIIDHLASKPYEPPKKPPLQYDAHCIGYGTNSYIPGAERWIVEDDYHQMLYEKERVASVKSLRLVHSSLANHPSLLSLIFGKVVFSMSAAAVSRLREIYQNHRSLLSIVRSVEVELVSRDGNEVYTPDHLSSLGQTWSLALACMPNLKELHVKSINSEQPIGPGLKNVTHAVDNARESELRVLFDTCLAGINKSGASLEALNADGSSFRFNFEEMKAFQALHLGELRRVNFSGYGWDLQWKGMRENTVTGEMDLQPLNTYPDLRAILSKIPCEQLEMVRFESTECPSLFQLMEPSLNLCRLFSAVKTLTLMDINLSRDHIQRLLRSLPKLSYLRLIRCTPFYHPLPILPSDRQHWLPSEIPIGITLDNANEYIGWSIVWKQIFDAVRYHQNRKRMKVDLFYCTREDDEWSLYVDFSTPENQLLEAVKSYETSDNRAAGSGDEIRYIMGKVGCTPYLQEHYMIDPHAIGDELDHGDN